MTMWLFAPLFLLACGPQEHADSFPNGQLNVSSDPIDFDVVFIGESEERSLFLDNPGEADLEVFVSIEDPTAQGVFAVDREAFEIRRADEPFELGVTFAPTSTIPYSATLKIEASDPDNPEVEISLSGNGVTAPVPDVCFDPLEHDFGAVAVGQVVPAVLAIESCGDGPLELGPLLQEGSAAFGIDPLTDPAGEVLDPGEQHAIVVYYEPVDALGDSGRVRVQVMNDPDQTEVEFLLFGN